MRSVTRLDNHRDGVSNHRSHLRHEVACLFEIEAVGSRITSRNLLPSVIDGGRVPTFELKEFGVAEAIHVTWYVSRK